MHSPTLTPNKHFQPTDLVSPRSMHFREMHTKPLVATRNGEAPLPATHA
jgi:hypothetical protein